MLGGEIVHLAEMPAFDRRDVIAVIDPEAALRQLAHLGHDFAIRAAAIEIIGSGADVIEARSDAAHGSGFAFAHRVLGQRPVDADMHVRIDAARKGELALGVEHFIGVFGADFRRQTGHLAVLDRNIEAVHTGCVRTHHARILDDEIERLHCGFLPFVVLDSSPA